MDPKSQLSPTSQSTSVCALLSLGDLTISPKVNATARNLGSWRSTYPNASTDGNLADPCAFCHASQTRANRLNTYRQAGYDLSEIESLNSDEDTAGSDKLEAINANTPPGLMIIFNQYQYCRVYRWI
jgi:hypothetical protein